MTYRINERNHVILFIGSYLCEENRKCYHVYVIVLCQFNFHEAYVTFAKVYTMLMLQRFLGSVSRKALDSTKIQKNYLLAEAHRVYAELCIAKYYSHEMCCALAQY